MPPKPSWLRVRLSVNERSAFVRNLVLDLGLHTVCAEAHCPNAAECWGKGTATFLILGDRCTRSCGFCAVAHGPEGLPDAGEPGRVAGAVGSMGLSYVVVTSVTRDDLPDGGALHFVSTLAAIRNQNPRTLVELLVPDFQGSEHAIGSIVAARPDVLGHNMETAPRLYGMVRPGADYRRSLGLLGRAHALDPHMPLKSGLMLGLGESREEVREILEDLKRVGCTFLTLGQYLQPSAAHLPVDRFIEPQVFDEWRSIAMEMGFRGVASGPLVRSSYHARDLYNETIGRPGEPGCGDHVQLLHGEV